MNLTTPNPLLHAVSLKNTLKKLQTDEILLADYLDGVCRRLADVEPQVQALVPEADRCARLRREAAALQAKYPRPADRPPLYGALVGIKDIFHVDGFPTQAGSNLPPEDLTGPQAVYVTRLKELGAIVLGKTVTTEFAYFDPGPTRNPHNPAHTPGGSSSGSAAGVAAGLMPLAFGTQTIGSIVRPAAFCGIVGFKPGYGRIDARGVLYVSRSLDHVGIFTQSIADMTIVAPLLCAGWQPLADSAATKPVLGAPDGAYLAQAEPEALAAFKAQLERLQEAGYQIRRVKALDNIETVAHNHQTIMAAEMAREHAALLPKYKSLYRPRTLALIEQGLAVTAGQLAAARAAQKALRAEMQSLMAEAGLDLWVTPAAPGPAPAGLSATGNPAMNLPWTQAGLPSLTVPAGLAANGLPLGFQCVAPFMADEKLLAWAAPIEQILKP